MRMFCRGLGRYVAPHAQAGGGVRGPRPADQVAGGPDLRLRVRRRRHGRCLFRRLPHGVAHPVRSARDGGRCRFRRTGADAVVRGPAPKDAPRRLVQADRVVRHQCQGRHPALRRAIMDTHARQVCPEPDRGGPAMDRTTGKRRAHPAARRHHRHRAIIAAERGASSDVHSAAWQGSACRCRPRPGYRSDEAIFSPSRGGASSPSPTTCLSPRGPRIAACGPFRGSSFGHLDE